MITASGAEGISLRNVRYVHLVDPYWHPVRLEQVIGRARRICSHKDLPPELQTVTVYFLSGNTYAYSIFFGIFLFAPCWLFQQQSIQ